MLGGIVLKKNLGKEKKELSINKGVELMLRKTNKKREVPKVFQIRFGKVISLFSREFHFQIDFYIKKK
jgi:hypothetical protein